ncbi:hypothetical protein [Motilimonas eburnea]|uniref:hypothetical protein n=1 Tax=Motilimonas eburnea TaxID=1737488 RepID=UPI001E49EDBE|nr:hypothetical protein [Motilimonas eburnea]MCE2571295.1 hypothetical protein [Motilimonas eburnea]
MNKRQLVTRLVILLALAIIASLYLLFFHVKPQHHVSAKDGWLIGFDQLPYAKQLSAQQNNPLFIYFTRSPCKDCDTFENDYLTLGSVRSQIAAAVKLKIKVDNDNSQIQALLKRYQIIRLPAMVIKHSPATEAIRVHVLMDLQQVWLPIPDYKRGNYTPLSETTLNVALERTFAIAKDLAIQQTEPK